MEPEREPSKAPAPFLKPYNFVEWEQKVRALWESSGYANPDVMMEQVPTRSRTRSSFPRPT